MKAPAERVVLVNVLSASAPSLSPDPRGGQRAVSGQGAPEVLGQLAAKVTMFLASFYKDEREWQGQKQHSYVGRGAVKRHCVLWRARSHSQVLACVAHVAAPRSRFCSALLRMALF